MDGMKVALPLLFALTLTVIAAAQTPATPRTFSLTFERGANINGVSRMEGVTVMVNDVQIQAPAAELRGQQLVMGGVTITVPDDVRLGELFAAERKRRTLEMMNRAPAPSK